MSLYKRGGVYWFKFLRDGRLVRQSTKQTSDKRARDIEARVKSELALGHWGVLSKKAKPTLSEFLKGDFLPFVTGTRGIKPGTAAYYKDGVGMLQKADVITLRIDEISDQHAQQFAARHAKLSASWINCGLRTLRRALNLAYEWGKLEKPAKITLAKGERQRDRVLSEYEVAKYLSACPQPWRDAATISVDQGFRPGEVFALQWPHVRFNGTGGLIRVADGKSKAARRVLPMTPRVYQVLCERHQAQGAPTEGWIFPSTSRDGHLNGDTSKDQHAKAIKDSGVKRFEPYVLRHTALTRMSPHCDVFTLARIAGHSSITITQRYVHPQADAVERAFAALNPGPDWKEKAIANTSEVGG
jgi:integrase